MKPAIADYQTKIYCLRIVPNWGDAIYLTGHVKDLVIGSNTYRTDYGYEFTGQSSNSTFAPGSLDITGIADLAGVDYDEIISGVFDNARIYAFATTWTNPVEDEEPIGLAFMGRITLQDTRYKAEVMMAIDALNQVVGDTYSAACPKKFGGQEFAGCGIDLAAITVTGAITGVVSNSQFSDSGRTEDDDYFGEGTISFTTGANAGLKPMEIKTYTGASGTIIVHEAFHYPVTIGDQYSMIPGCRKRKSDCIDKWNNIVNFGGFSFIPTSSQYQSRG